MRIDMTIERFSLNNFNLPDSLVDIGPDGSSVAPLTAAPSRDDIVRAGNGSFFGVAENF